MTSKANSSPRTDSQLMQFSTTNISPGLLANFSSIICLFQAIFNSTTASIPTTHKDKDLVVGGLNTCPTNPASYLHWKIEKKHSLRSGLTNLHEIWYADPSFQTSGQPPERTQRQNTWAYYDEKLFMFHELGLQWTGG